MYLYPFWGHTLFGEVGRGTGTGSKRDRGTWTIMLRMWFRRARDPASSTATEIHRKPSLDFSLTGLVYSSMMMFMGLAAINSQANLLFGVFGLMIGILLISGIISRTVLRKLSVSRALPDHGIVGAPMTI